MKHRTATIALTAIIALSASAYAFGGWAVITIKDLPTSLTAGVPTEFTFSIRQHGEEPINGLSPVVQARSGSMLGGAMVEAAAAPGKVAGQYTAKLTIPKPGEWTVTVKSGFGPSNLKLLPLRAGDGKTTVAAIAGAELGKHLFVAKGCVACHVHSAVESQGSAKDYGPNLTDKRFDATYLTAWLANPAIRPPTKAGQQMPNLGLSTPEVTALTAFINGTRVASNK